MQTNVLQVVLAASLSAAGAWCRASPKGVAYLATRRVNEWREVEMNRVQTIKQKDKMKENRTKPIITAVWFQAWNKKHAQ